LDGVRCIVKNKGKTPEPTNRRKRKCLVESAVLRERRRQRRRPRKRRSNSLVSRAPLFQEGCYMAPKKKTSKKAGKASKKKRYYRGKEVRACKSR
jgi:hypothetical protein